MTKIIVHFLIFIYFYYVNYVTNRRFLIPEKLKLCRKGENFYFFTFFPKKQLIFFEIELD